MKNEKPRFPDRPVEYPMPEPIPDTPENIAKAILTTLPKKKKKWRYMRERDGESE